MNFINRLSTRSAPGCFILGLVWLAMAFILCGGYLTVQEQIGILRGSQTVTGKIVNAETIDRDGSVGYFLTYEYDPGYGDPPDVRTGRQKVDSALYKRYPAGSVVQVYFQPDARDISMILAVDELTGMLGVALACGIPFVMTTLILLSVIRARLRGDDDPRKKHDEASSSFDR